MRPASNTSLRGFFGECVQPTRRAAEQYAIDKLVGLGEDRSRPSRAVRFVGYTAACARGADLSGRHGLVHFLRCTGRMSPT